MSLKRIAPNNQLPATHFIEVWKSDCKIITSRPFNFHNYLSILDVTKVSNFRTICIFHIRKNKLPTLHNFNK